MHFTFRERRLAVAAVLCAATCACSGNDADDGGSTVATQPVAVVWVDPGQYRDDVVADRLQLQLHNDSPETLAVRMLQMRWSSMETEPTDVSITVVRGQVVDVPVPVGVARCSIVERTINEPDPASTASVTITTEDGSIIVAPIYDPSGTLLDLHASQCQRAMVETQVSLEFVSLDIVEFDGRPIVSGLLKLDRRGASGAVEVSAASGTIPFRLSFPSVSAGEPIVELVADRTTASVAVQILEARCDAHAVAETKQPFRFVMQINFGDGEVIPYVVNPTAEAQPMLWATHQAACAALGENGALG
jgi:hypothetical protein